MRMMQPIGTNATSNLATKGNKNPPIGLGFGVVCPSDCLSDWDKRKTPVTKSCSATTCDGRQSSERRGQDSLKACLLLFAVWSKRLI